MRFYNLPAKTVKTIEDFLWHDQGMGIELARVRIGFGHWLLDAQQLFSLIPGIPKADAITVGNTVYFTNKWKPWATKILKDSLPDNKYFLHLLIHELDHVWQYQRAGERWWHCLNVLWAFRKGYSGSKYESGAYDINRLFAAWLVDHPLN